MNAPLQIIYLLNLPEEIRQEEKFVYTTALFWTKS
jgi:hypothetical protein